MDPSFDRSRLWKRQTGRQHTSECWDSPEIWYSAYGHKEKEAEVRTGGWSEATAA